MPGPEKSINYFFLERYMLAACIFWRKVLFTIKKSFSTPEATMNIKSFFSAEEQLGSLFRYKVTSLAR
jgi:hypothetical protein